MAIWGFGEDDEEHMSLQKALQHVWTVVFLLHAGYQGAWRGSVVGMSESTVFALRIANDPSLVHEVFSFVADPWLATRVHRFRG